MRISRHTRSQMSRLVRQPSIITPISTRRVQNSGLDTPNAFPHSRFPMTSQRTMQSTMTPAYAGWVVVFARLRGSLGINVNANKRHIHPQGCFSDA